MVENVASSEPVFPRGTVAFLFTGVELLDQLQDQYEVLISAYHQIARDIVTKPSVYRKELQQ